MDDGGRPGLDTAMIAIDSFVPTDGGIFEIIGFLLGHEEFDIFAQRALITLQGQDIIGFLVHDLLGDGTLATHRVDGDDGAFDVHHLEQLGNGDDLVGLFGDLDLSEHQALTRGEGRDHVDCCFSAFLMVRSAQRLAIDRDHIRRNAGQRGNPADEAALEMLGVERGEDVAEVVVRGRSFAKRPKPAQEGELLAPEARDIDECLRPGQHRQQAQQQHLVERIHHLAALASIRQIFKILQENNRFPICVTVRCLATHRRYPPFDSEDHDRFSTLPNCHALLHPIALGSGTKRRAMVIASSLLG